MNYEIPTVCRLCASDLQLLVHRHADLGIELSKAMTRSTTFEQECEAKDVEIEKLRTRQQELLEFIRAQSQTTPFEDEAGQVAVLIAEVGTLRSIARTALDGWACRVSEFDDDHPDRSMIRALRESVRNS